MSPKEGAQTFYSNYCNTLTHGLPSGQTNDDKKAVRLKIAGGKMTDVLHNSYLHESVKEAADRDE